LKLNFKSGKAKLTIDEGERLFEQLVLGRPYDDAPFITARICGICPTAHVLASIAALESAFDVQVTPNIVNLRKILHAGQMIQSHALHLFFLALPDYLNVTNAIELHQKNPEIYRTAIALKKLGDKLTEVIGGRSVHPVTPVVGGFLSVPTDEELRELARELESHMHMALATVELFAGFKYPNIKRETEYLMMKNRRIISNQELDTPLENYAYAFKENVREESQTKYGTRDGHGFMVGALARLSLGTESLHPKALYALDKVWGKKLPTYNSFHNNVAQAIEIVDLIETALESISAYLDDKNRVMRVPFTVKESSGVGAVEAPRGTLYHAVKLDTKGNITLYDIVTPTVQNLVNLEEDADWLMKEHSRLTEEKLY
ncbi:MAG TPA: nickel-dependent hydrogenase large subunit, partial [Methylococcales bacterium]